MNTPLFCYENGDLRVARNLKDLVGVLEKFDVEQKEYVFWDAAGEEFDLDTERWPSFFSKVDERIIAAPENPIGVRRIEGIVRDFCRKNGISDEGNLAAMGEALLRRSRKP